MRIFEIIKPEPVYYHGSNTGGLKMLTPSYSDLIGDDVVFAAVLPEVAVAMTGHWTDDDFYFGHAVSTKQEIKFTPYVFKELKSGAFDEFFSGQIYIYTVPADRFEEHENLQDFEVVSYRPVKVHSVIKVENALEYLEASPYIKLIYK